MFPYTLKSTTSLLLCRPRTCAFFLCISVLLVYIWYTKHNTDNWNDTYIMKLVNSKLSIIMKNEKKNIIEKEKNRGLILDTPGCKIPKLNPFDPSIIDLYEQKEPYDCPGPPLFLKSEPGGFMSLNETILDIYYHLKPNEIFCVYQGIYRKYEEPGNVRENNYDLTSFNELRFNVPLNQDSIFVICDLGGKENFTHYFPLVHLKEDVEKVKSKISPPVPQLNIILAGIDSISKLNFLRHFRKTQSFMKRKGNWFDIKGYVKVGDNTFPNLIPLLTGQHVETIWNETLKDTMYFDDVDIIWKKYSEKGYRTFYAEDMPIFGTFNYGRRGFNEAPTDYYMRPLYLAMRNSELREKYSKVCFNSKLETEIMYDYLRDFIRTMDTRPYFAFAMSSSLTHDYLNHAGHADYPTADLLEDLLNIGALNNSVMILFGDHGMRFGSIRSTYIGKYEERMPFMYIHFPSWVLEQYPFIYQNLQDNTERLVTLFDVYATMVHLLDPISKPTQEEKSLISPYGLSLIGEISPYRTCEKAGIFHHWCTCQQFQFVSLKDQEIVKSVQAVDDYFQYQIQSYLHRCVTISVNEVVDAKLGQINDLVLRFLKHESTVIDRSIWYTNRIVKYEDFFVSLSTKPCNDVYEATVRHNVEDDSYDVVDIINIDYYPNKYKCIDDQQKQPFCCCK